MTDDTAHKLAWAHKEGGVMGLGSPAMSREERSMMGVIARALGYGRA